ncbi:MAG: RnfABCDGE type electron transport complex subunit B, partial [Spongiibacteraceae bacterium]|nr:RnfABCDGE type electron transport complex subunit B [Spongiibacteraceae bacterium]
MIDLLAQHPLIAASGALLLLGALFGAVLGYAAVRFRVEGNPIVDDIENLLPQTQCGQCGYPGCRPYAEAIA